ncbi:Zn-ribbon domain-containing OB-fold protein [Erythrobacter sp. EC-HK427]|uniref:Zn-ribbon domain-containing OB-fold protein n=1 Tax=Erythrobacter sp. EC-HK427 TaxID=2038396 RepID=UPI00125344B6|nr:OB-fold domain-containing protein [Erythrobacter sp. EC-HK427]VVT00319.1 conserved hypothetical protein [Erythrobacter sp. EC-HK427]
MTPNDAPGPEARWREALDEGRILLQRDPASGAVFFPPRVCGPEGQALEWIEACGTGTVYAVTTIHPRPPLEPYNVALVDLAEGVRMMSRVDGIAADDIAIGSAVVAAIAQTRDGPLVVFHPA